MNSISNMSSYLHTYEAYRLPKGTKVQSASGKEVVSKEDQLVLTEESQKQLIKDRVEFGSAMLEEKKRINAERNQEAEKKMSEDQAKMIAVFRSMSEGKMVSDTDEKKLMEYDPKLYMAAKMAQMMAQRAEEEKESHFNKSDEEEFQKKIDSYNKKTDEINKNWNSTVDNFVNAQKESIVEVDSAGIDFSSIKSTIDFGGGITGAVYDVSV